MLQAEFGLEYFLQTHYDSCRAATDCFSATRTNGDEDKAIHRPPAAIVSMHDIRLIYNFFNSYAVPLLCRQPLGGDHIVSNCGDYVSRSSSWCVEQYTSVQKCASQFKHGVKRQSSDEWFRPALTALFNILLELDPTKIRTISTTVFKRKMKMFFYLPGRLFPFALGATLADILFHFRENRVHFDSWFVSIFSQNEAHSHRRRKFCAKFTIYLFIENNNL